MNKFEIVSKYKDKNINLPIRATEGSSGYDFECAADTIIPSYIDLRNSMTTHLKQFGKQYTLDEIKKITSVNKLKFVTFAKTDWEILQRKGSAAMVQ